MYFFTSDEHYNHRNILTYSARPFQTIEEMNEELIERHNKKVTPQDITVHVGDFAFYSGTNKAYDIDSIIKRLNGTHIFIKGSHDSWLRTSKIKATNQYFHEIYTKKIDGIQIVACHYAMRVWPKSHYGSWLLYGHSHGTLEPIGKSHDVGVDTNNFYPYSFEEIKEIMENKEDNFNLSKK